MPITRLLSLLLLLTGLTAAAQRADDSRWKAIDHALSAGKLKSVLPQVQKQARTARSRREPLQELKALVYEGRIRIATEDDDADLGRRPEADFLDRFDQARLRQTPATAERVLFDLYLAEYLEQYAGRRATAARTGLTAPPSGGSGRNFADWSRDNLERCVDSLYAEAAAAREALCQTPRHDFALLVGNKDPDRIGTHLIDFVAPAAARWFDRRQPGSATAESLLRARADFHAADADKTAWIDAELQLALRRPHDGDEALRQLIGHLERLARANRTAPYAAQLWLQAAQLSARLSAETDSARNCRRHAMLTEGLALFPDSKWKAGLHNDLNDLECVEIGLSAFSLNSPGQHVALQVTHRNASRPTLRLESLDALTEADAYTGRREPWQQGTLRKDLRPRLVRQEALSLRAFADYAAHSTLVDLGVLPCGVYRVSLAEGGKTASTLFAVSGVTATLLPDTAAGTARVRFADSRSGLPLCSEPFRFHAEGQTARPSEGRTDADGCFRFPAGPDDGRYIVFFPQRGDAVTAGVRQFLPAKNESREDGLQTAWFTDRAVYRLGQSVQFKLIAFGPSAEGPLPAAGRRLQVALRGAGGKRLDSLSVVTSPTGGAWGSFTLPASALPGTYVLETEGGSHFFEVQEYKRPRFEVILDPVAGAYAQGDTVRLTGRAVNYSGPALAGARVGWRLEYRNPMPYPLRPGRPQGRDAVLASGTAETGADGTFSVSVRLDADSLPDYLRHFAPAYRFTADVTDLGGETQSATRSFSASRQRLNLVLDAPDRTPASGPVRLGLRALNADGQPVAARGELRILRMHTPRPARLLWPHRQLDADYSLYAYDDFTQRFPHLRAERGEDSFTRRGAAVASLAFDTALADSLTPGRTLGPGTYLFEAETVCRGDTLRAERLLTLLDGNLAEADRRTFLAQHAPERSLAAGDTARIVWLSDVPEAELFVSLERHGRLQPPLRLRFEQGRATLALALDTADARHGLCWQATLAACGDQSSLYGRLDVTRRPLATLRVRVHTFRPRLEPGAPERWTLDVSRDGRSVEGEAVATLYDASLDAFAAHAFRFRPDANYARSLVLERTRWQRRRLSTALDGQHGDSFARLPRKPRATATLDEPQLDFFGLTLDRPYAMAETKSALRIRGRSMSQMMLMKNDYAAADGAMAEAAVAESEAGAAPAGGTAPAVRPRSRLQETAFFFPALKVERGSCALRFTAPEALGRWRLLALAVTDSLEYGQTELTVETRKPLMLMPALPRFTRRGDTLSLSARIRSTLDRPARGTARLELFSLADGRSLDAACGLGPAARTVELDADGSAETRWTLVVPDGAESQLGIRMTVQTDAGSDGEENALPVLERRATLRQTEILSLRPGARVQATAAPAAECRRLTLELTTDMAVPALLALPSLARPEHESSDQTLTRAYAAAAAGRLLALRPGLAEAVGAWNAANLGSALGRSRQLAGYSPDETPWAAAADDETARARAMAALVDDSLRQAAADEAWQRLAARQRADGGFPWFDGGPSVAAITERIVLGIGRLRALDPASGGRRADTLLARATAYTDSAMLDYTARCAREKQKPSARRLLDYFHARSLAPAALPLPAALGRLVRTAVAEALTPDRLAADTPGDQARAALTAWRHGLKKEARRLVGHLRESAVSDERRGLYWRRAAQGSPWAEDAVSAHAAALQAFVEIEPADSAARQGLETWLAGSRRRSDWGSPAATADAVAALVAAGSPAAAGESRIALGTTRGTLPEGRRTELPGYLRVCWQGEALTPALDGLTLENRGPATARGGLMAEREADLRDFTTGGTGLRVERRYYAVRLEDGRTRLEETDTPRVGQRLVERVTVHAGEALDFVHLRLDRPAGLEPAGSHSGHILADGIGAYRSVHDDAVHLFFDRLPAGTHVFEEELRATTAGTFETGRAEIGSLYAPEYTARAASRTLRIAR